MQKDAANSHCRLRAEAASDLNQQFVEFQHDLFTLLLTSFEGILLSSDVKLHCSVWECKIFKCDYK